MNMTSAIVLCEVEDLKCKRVGWEDKFIFAHNIYYKGRVDTFIKLCDHGVIVDYQPTVEDTITADWEVVED